MAAPSSSMTLIGPGWGGWRGVWTSRRVLERRDRAWVLRCDGHEEGRWSSFVGAAESLWTERSRRDEAPWGVGWNGYEDCAEMAGQLPTSADEPTEPRSWWLIEPRLVSLWGGRLGDGGPRADAARTVSLDDDAFRDRVTAIRERIAAGDAYQVNLTRRFTVDGWKGGLQPLHSSAVRDRVPDYLSVCGFEGGELVCASMELLVRRRGARVETRPIKGTRPRGATAAEDMRLAADLDADAKERAELAMIVDLERNDLGAIAKTGTVEVVDPGRVHTYGVVHHRVARVVARVSTDLPWWRVMAAMAPGGSVTGCPKIAAMELIAKLEATWRGPYTGVLGVIAGNGDLELALPIRTAWRVGEKLHFAAGCGIVWESDPAREERESRLKVAPWLELAR